MPPNEAHFVNARPDPARPPQSLLVRDGRFVAIGPAAVVSPRAATATPDTDLNHAVVTPGFHDCHLHLLWYGRQLLTQADLVGSSSVEDVVDRLAAMAGKSDGWIQGHGFDQSKLAEGGFPTRDDLDRVSRTRPVIISRICGHAAVANSAAIELLTPDQQSRGDPTTGLYTEASIAAFYRRIPPLDEETDERALLAGMSVALRSGITSVQTMLDTVDQMAVYTRLRRRLGCLPIRVVAMPPEYADETLHTYGIGTTFGDEWLRFGAVKFFSDGSLGARTAWLDEPYADDASTRGIRMYDPADLKARCRRVQDRGFQIAIHAIGDAALRESIDAIEFALQGEDNAFFRHRIEHASVCPPRQMERLVKLNIPVTIQPQFVTSDTWTGERLGRERTPWAYPFRTMLRAGVKMGLSSDCPVEKLDAADCMNSAINRAAWSRDETLTHEECLDLYTRGSAYLSHREQEVGEIREGHFADFVVMRDGKLERVFVGGMPVTQSKTEPRTK